MSMRALGLVGLSGLLVLVALGSTSQLTPVSDASPLSQQEPTAVPTPPTPPWCPPLLKRAYATARLETSRDNPRVKADEIIEVPNPWLESCGSLYGGDRWARQVMWLVDDDFGTVSSSGGNSNG